MTVRMSRHKPREVLARIDGLLAQAGSDKDHVLNATIYLEDIGTGFAPMNEVWSAWLSPGMAPTRGTLQAELARPVCWWKSVSSLYVNNQRSRTMEKNSC